MEWFLLSATCGTGGTNCKVAVYPQEIMEMLRKLALRVILHIEFKYEIRICIFAKGITEKYYIRY